MGWLNQNSMLRLLLLLGLFLGLPFILHLTSGYFDPLTVKGNMIALLLWVFPLVTLVLAIWDGLKTGFNPLWIAAPFLFFLAPMYLFYNDSALIYGVLYAALGLLGTTIGTFSTKSSARKENR
ncbi:MAG: iron ABC transporter [Actinomycetaceae bacterium]|nr:iron ABC transporter [Actinomycetaceae bacterium]